MMDSLKKPGCYSLRERGVGVLRLLRPKQWVKNAFVLAPLIFSGQFLVPQQFMQGLLMVALFCVASSAVYIVNDWCDMAQLHKSNLRRVTPTPSRGYATAAV